MKTLELEQIFCESERQNPPISFEKKFENGEYIGKISNYEGDRKKILAIKEETLDSLSRNTLTIKELLKQNSADLSQILQKIYENADELKQDLFSPAQLRKIILNKAKANGIKLFNSENIDKVREAINSEREALIYF